MPGRAGTRASTRSSSGRSAVVNGPSKKSRAAIVRVPDFDLATRSASMASMTAPQSPDGSAWASEPHTVPRFRTSGSETCGAASAMVG